MVHLEADTEPPCFVPGPAGDAVRAWFDSTRLDHHRKAAAICERCPFTEACDRLAHATSEEFAWAPHGTWAGRLWTKGRLSPKGNRA